MRLCTCTSRHHSEVRKHVMRSHTSICIANTNKTMQVIHSSLPITDSRSLDLVLCSTEAQTRKLRALSDSNSGDVNCQAPMNSLRLLQLSPAVPGRYAHSHQVRRWFSPSSWTSSSDVLCSRRQCSISAPPVIFRVSNSGKLATTCCSLADVNCCMLCRLSAWRVEAQGKVPCG